MPRSEILGAAILVVASLVVGFAAEPVVKTAGVAGQQLAEPQAYIDAVLHNPRYAKDKLADAKASPYPAHDPHHHASYPARAAKENHP